MSGLKKYNIFITISTFARSIVEILSPVFLYKFGYNIREILLFYLILYLIGLPVNYITLKLTKKMNTKYLLMSSSILFGLSFLLLEYLPHNLIYLITFSIIYSISHYTYHSLRHFYALKSLDINKMNKGIGNILILSYIALIPSVYLGGLLTNKFGLITTIIVSIILSIISIIPITKMRLEHSKEKVNIKEAFKKVPRKTIYFFVLEQFKVIFIALQPLYLYLYISKSLEYIGIFNILLGVSASIFLYFFVRKIKYKKHAPILITLLTIIMLIKINIYNQTLMLIVAFFEGLLTKSFEVISTHNLYQNSNKLDTASYLIVAEAIFCISSSLIILSFMLINDIRIIMYISIFGIFLTSFYNKIKEMRM